jgi:hypothetical protein
VPPIPPTGKAVYGPDAVLDIYPVVEFHVRVTGLRRPQILDPVAPLVDDYVNAAIGSSGPGLYRVRMSATRVERVEGRIEASAEKTYTVAQVEAMMSYLRQNPGRSRLSDLDLAESGLRAEERWPE